MLLSVENIAKKIEEGQILFLAGDEALLKQLPPGKWIGGTIPYFMTAQGGVFNRDLIFATELPEKTATVDIQWYAENELERVSQDAPDNGFSIIIMPANSAAHITYAQNAPMFPELFLKPIIGWISGVDLQDLGKVSPKVFSGFQGESSAEKAIVMHVTLPADKIAEIGIVNIFSQGNGDSIVFEDNGFSVKDCLVNGKKQNFASYLQEQEVDQKYPLVANYCGAMVNVSFQNIDFEEGVVQFYAPVFKGVEYKLAQPVEDYVSAFKRSVPQELEQPEFSCNCILNYLFSELEGKKTGHLIGPITFGEIAYQLLNQTLVYLKIQPV